MEDETGERREKRRRAEHINKGMKTYYKVSQACNEGQIPYTLNLHELKLCGLFISRAVFLFT